MQEDDLGGRFRKKRVNFAMVSNEAIHNENLSLKAKGLYALVQSYITIEDFILYKSFLLNQCKEGKKSFETAWKELKDVGYLIQHRMQDTKTKHFFWEYELLDTIKSQPQNGGMGGNEPYPQKGYYGKGMLWERDAMEKGCYAKGGRYNNTINNNIISNNTKSNNIINNNTGSVLSNHIISNHILSIDDIRRQIGYETFDKIRLEQIDEIVLLMLDVMNAPDESKIRINRADMAAYKVKERYRLLNQSHIEYVLEMLSRQIEPIGNMRAYLLTALYNAPVTMDSFYQNWVNHGMYGDQSE